jgi:hypothetical protein
MVTARHEAMHRISQEDPGVFARAFKALDIPFPAPTSAAVLSPDVTEIQPLERRIDSLIRFETADDGSYLVVVEAQSRQDPKKPGAWAYYAAHLQEKYKVPVVLLVVCQDASTARWAAAPVHFGLPQWQTLTLRPLVVGPQNVPAITSVAEASRDIPLATLSVITHARDPEVGDMLTMLAAALRTTDEETARVFAELTELGLGDTAAAQSWSKMMVVDTSFFRSRTSQILRAQGRAQGLADGVLRNLSARGIEIPDEVRERVEACEDRELIEIWHDRSLTVAHAEEIFDDHAA